ncbi:MAG: ParB-like protein [Stellaceae bacterium]|jgi:hypothetical protein
MNTPTSTKAKLAKLRPTQMTLGYAEVALKRKQWRALGAKEAREFLRAHRFPAISGPKGRLYITDHHHLGRALQEEKVATVNVAVLADLSSLDRDEFWILMDFQQWAHPYDAQGRRRDFSSIPKNLKRLPDDPFRSLAAQVRRKGDYPKDATPFAEFLWADFFRRRISADELRRDPDKALRRAKRLARSLEAAHLPGWSGIGKS